jgi:hypothetical protein
MNAAHQIAEAIIRDESALGERAVAWGGGAIWMWA